MAKLEIELSTEEKAVLEQEASTHGLTMTDFARQRLFGQLTNGKAGDTNRKAVTFTAEDGYQFKFLDDAEEPVSVSIANVSKPIISAKNAAAIAMLDEWLAEDATDDPELIRKATEEYEELKRNLNENR